MAKIKLCGLFRPEDIAAANEAKPDYIGFVFANSRRRVSFAQAAALREQLAPGILPVGVFVNADIAEICALYRAGVIAIAQLHGGESEDDILALKQACNVPILQALNIENASQASPLAEYHLYDHGSGGTGEQFDWRQLQNIKQDYFLAGGIGLHNIDEALSQNPFAIDISSGAETGGRKDREKMIALVERVRGRC